MSTDISKLHALIESNLYNLKQQETYINTERISIQKEKQSLELDKQEHASAKKLFEEEKQKFADEKHKLYKIKNCVCCYEDILIVDAICLIPCGHSIVCTSCYDRLNFNRTTNKKHCPLCREPVTKIVSF